MNTTLLLTFVGLNVVNVIIQTVKSICTIKCNKFVAAFANAIAYGLYTIVTIYMLCELPILWKAIIVALCNLIGVFVVKLIEEKMRKDKLWKVEATITYNNKESLIKVAQEMGLSFNYINSNEYVIFNFYCKTQNDSVKVKNILKMFNAKYFVSETKEL